MSSGWDELNDDEMLFWPDLTLSALQQDLIKIADEPVETQVLATPTEFDQIKQTMADTQFQACCVKFDALNIIAAFSDTPLTMLHLKLELPTELSSSTVPVDKKILEEVKVDENQNRKDIHRDQITVNGKFRKGSELGYDGLMHMLVDNLDGDKTFASRCVSIGCRTFSGGISLQVVMDAFSYADYVIVPESLQARPIEFLTGRKSALIRAHTRYSLRSADDAETVHGMVDAVFLCDVASNKAAVHLQVEDSQ
jgi:hypothetical protein